jgi:gluconolactonase
MNRWASVVVAAAGAVGAVVLVATLSVRAQVQSSPAGATVVRLSPALDDILSVDAKLDVVRQDYFGATEGPVWFKEASTGYLLFSDMGANRIYRWDPASARLSVFLEGSGFSTMDLTDVRVLDNGRLLVAVLGSNGLAQDREGRLVFCTHGDRSIVRLEPDGRRTVLADRFEGKRFNGPNDLVVRSDGSIYFSDLGAGLRGGPAKSPDRELDFQGLFRWKPDGTVQVASRTLTNGVAFSPDERYLYTSGAGGGITRHEVMPDGTVANGRLHVDMRGQPQRGGADGVRVDRRGNLFSSGPGGVWIATAEGQHIGTIFTPDRNEGDNSTSVAFGDSDGKGLYITTVRSVYHIRMHASAW